MRQSNPRTLLSPPCSLLAKGSRSCFRISLQDAPLPGLGLQLEKAAGNGQYMSAIDEDSKLGKNSQAGMHLDEVAGGIIVGGWVHPEASLAKAVPLATNAPLLERGVHHIWPNAKLLRHVKDLVSCLRTPEGAGIATGYSITQRADACHYLGTELGIMTSCCSQRIALVICRAALTDGILPCAALALAKRFKSLRLARVRLHRDTTACLMGRARVSRASPCSALLRWG